MKIGVHLVGVHRSSRGDQPCKLVGGQRSLARECCRKIVEQRLHGFSQWYVGLVRKLQHAIDRLLDGRVTSAVNQLGVFINEVEAMIANGLISADDGSSIIATAQWAADNV